MADYISDVAVIGIGCRFPGGAHDGPSFWSLMEAGTGAWSEVPNQRFRESSFFSPNRGATAAYSHHGGHFLNQDIAAFDANFWDISSMEAEAMDPQQRIQLEVAYEALENAGLSLNDVRGSATGVYTAIFTHDYENMIYKDISSCPKYAMTGVGCAIASNRISYLLDLRGPSITLDTGCSGSLVALHQACQSLGVGETEMALVGGTNLILSPDTMVPMDRLGILNTNGICYSFDDRGSGYGRGEGVAVVVLKRVSDAIVAGDPIRAVIRSTAVGQDGRTKSLTLPNSAAQESIIRSAYKAARLDPRETGYVEAHGTGTVAGDRTELEAVNRVFCSARDDVKLYVGSVKANLGHLESTSGLAGLIKTILILEKELIPPVPNMEQLKPDLYSLMHDMEIPRHLLLWPENVPVRASVNSFGYGGTNAHVILESESAWRRSLDGRSRNQASLPSINENYPQDKEIFHEDEIMKPAEQTTKATTIVNQTETQIVLESQSDFYIILVTAKARSSLLSNLANLREWARATEKKDVCTRNLAQTLNLRRTYMDWRYTFVSSGYQDTMAGLDPQTVRPVQTAKNHTVVYVFTGQGAQWPGMGQKLLHFKHFEQSLIKSRNILRDLGAAWDLCEEIFHQQHGSRLHSSEIGQPATTSIQIALVDLLQELDIRPNGVIGHSSGEIAAAYAAGVLSHESALRISYHRGFLAGQSLQKMNKRGAMLAVGAGETEINTHISGLRNDAHRVTFACVNSPSSNTLSGDEDVILELKRSFTMMGVPSTRLQVDTAYHSHHMQAVAEDYSSELQGIHYTNCDSKIKFFSSVTGTEKASGFGENYWVSNLVSQVRFSQAIEALYHGMNMDTTVASNYQTYIEIGPHNTLLRPLSQNLTALEKTRSTTTSFSPNLQPLLRRGQNSQQTFFRAIAKLLEKGYAVDLRKLQTIRGKSQGQLITDLPPYSWDHSTTYWHRSRLVSDHHFRSSPFHDLLGYRIAGVIEPTWRHILSVETLPWLFDHKINNAVIFPASGYVAMALEAVKQLVLEKSPQKMILKYTLRNVVFSNFLEIPTPPDSIEVQLILREADIAMDRISVGQDDFSIFSISPTKQKVQHCRGTIQVELYDHEKDSSNGYNLQAYKERLLEIQATSKKVLSTDRLYEISQKNGNHWGPNFAMIKKYQIGQHCATGDVQIPDIASCMPRGDVKPHIMHPATLDALMQTGVVLFSRDYERGVVFPIRIGELIVEANTLSVPHTKISFGTSIQVGAQSTAVMEVIAFQQGKELDSRLSVYLKDCELRGLPNNQIPVDEGWGPHDHALRLHWGPDVDHYNPSPESATQSTSLSAASQAQREKTELLNNALEKFMASSMISISATEVTGRHSKYFEWIQQYLFRTESRCEVLRSMEPLSDIRSVGVEGEALWRVGSNLVPILTGRLDPVALLFEGDLLENFYANETASRRCYMHMAEFVKSMAFKEPGLKILEVGAGTGGATRPLLEALDLEHEPHLIKRYDFTDVSQGFFDKARKKLCKWEHLIRFRTLDISEDPVQQGFDIHDYDLILACNVLHVSVNVDVAISHCRQLIADAGKLLLLEITELSPFINGIFGVLPGWYINRTDGRENSPILSVDQWRDHLQKESFNGIEFHQHDVHGSAHSMTMIVSGTASDQEMSTTSSLVCILKRRDNSGEQHLIAEQIGHLLSSAGVQNRMQDDHGLEIAANSICIILDVGEASPTVSWESRKKMERLATKHANILWVTDQLNSVIDSSWAHSSLGESVIESSSTSNQPRLVVLSVHVGTHLDSLAFTICRILKQSILSPQDLRSEERHYVYRDGHILIPRFKRWVHPNHVSPKALFHNFSEKVFHEAESILTLNIELFLSSKKLVFSEEFTAEKLLQADLVEISVEAYELNIDLLLQARNFDLSRGFGCSGTVTNVGSNARELYRIGDRVCCWNVKDVANRIEVEENCVQRLPSIIPTAFAASTPCPFIVAYHALVTVACLATNQTILIDSATSPLSKAALQIANCLAARVIVWVETHDQRAALSKELSIPTESILLRNDDAANQWMHRFAKGSGADVVLQTTPDLISDNLTCLASFGTLVGIDLPDTSVISASGSKVFSRSITFSNINTKQLLENQSGKAKFSIENVMRMFENGELTPRYVTTHTLDEIGVLFTAVSAETRTENTVLSIPKGTIVNCSSEIHRLSQMQEAETYLVAGTLDDLKQEISSLLATRGARTVVFVNEDRRSVVEQDYRLERDHLDTGSCPRVISCNVAGWQSSQDDWYNFFKVLPPVRGIIHILGRSERWCEKHEPTELCISNPTFPRIFVEKISHRALDFSVTISSASSIAEALQQSMMLSLWPNQESTYETNSDPTTGVNGPQMLAMRTTPLTETTAFEGNGEVLTIVEDCLSLKAENQQGMYFWTRCGLDNLASTMPGNPTIAHTVLSSDREQTDIVNNIPQSYTELLDKASSTQAAQDIILSALQQKIYTFVTIQVESLDVHAPIEDLGLDSLVRFEFRDWILHSLHAQVEGFEISSTANLMGLTTKIIERSDLLKHLRPGTENNLQRFGKLQTPHAEPAETVQIREPPRQPLIPLDETLALFLATARPFCNEEEYNRLALTVEKFKDPEDLGPLLHGVLAEKAQGPDVPNWLGEYYMERRFLRLRTPLNMGQIYFGTHYLGDSSHIQARKAALITSATLAFKLNCESGKQRPHSVGGQEVDKDLYSLLFHTYREPHLELDVLKIGSRENYFVVLRYGQAYKIEFDIASNGHDIGKLEETFGMILRDTSKTDAEWVGILTADYRDTWAKSRESLIEGSEINKRSIQTIEQAAFIVCLDDATPDGPIERCRQFLFTTDADRWYDKSLQLIICSNGVSASIYEHSSVDGVAVEPLHQAINQAIKSSTSPLSYNTPASTILVCENLPIIKTPDISRRVHNLRDSLKAKISAYTFSSLNTNALNSSFLRKNKCPSQSGIQLAIQAALRRFFGESIPAQETVSLAHFLGGRVEVHHIIQPAVGEFLDALASSDVSTVRPTEDSSPPRDLRTLFYAAAVAHAKSLTRCSAGRGFSRHLLAMEWVFEDYCKEKAKISGSRDVQTPELFADEVYKRMKPGKIMTSCFTTGWMEGGFVYPVLGSVLIYFEFDEEEVRFSIFGNEVDADSVREKLVEAIAEIRALIEGSWS